MKLLFINKIETLVKEKSNIKNEILSLEMHELENINNNHDFVFYNISNFNDNMTVDEKRACCMNIFKEITYDPKEDTFEFSFK